MYLQYVNVLCLCIKNVIKRIRKSSNDVNTAKPFPHDWYLSIYIYVYVSGAGPLHGLRVIDSGCFLAGPLVGLYLAAYGAEVIKIEKVSHLYLSIAMLRSTALPLTCTSIIYNMYS